MTEENRDINQERLDSVDELTNEGSADSNSESINEDVLSKESKPSTVFLSTYSIIRQQEQNSDIYGVSFNGRYHQENGIFCQDYHKFKDLSDGWTLFIVADGAGSSSQSHRGAKMNCEIGAHLIEKMISSLKWKERDSLPTPVEWQVNFTSLCRLMKDFIISKISALDEPCKVNEFSATFLVLIVSPKGMLAGHIGDGRMGYRDAKGAWHSLMTPHKGSEPNQTVFLLSAWDTPRIPALAMSMVFVPETRIVTESPQAVCLLSDGNENASWECVQWIEEDERYADKNLPFATYWNKLITEISLASNDDRQSHFINFVDTFNEASRLEGDDRTVLLGIFSSDKISETESSVEDVMQIVQDAPKSSSLEESDEDD